MFIDSELDICPGYGWQGGPSFSTRVVALQSWMERRNANNIECRHQYSLPIQNLANKAYLTYLKQAFLAARGQLHSFKVKDWSDFESNAELFAVGDGSTTVFQLIKQSTFGIASYQRTIRKPMPGVQIFANGALQSATVDLTKGQVTFPSAPASGTNLTWTGEFWVPVRFNSDVLQVTIDNYRERRDYAINGSIDLIEVFGE